MWGGVSFVQDGSQEACSLIGGMVQTNGTRICEINILEYMRVSSKNSTIILGAKTCEGLPTEICLCYTCTWVQVVIWILKIYAKDNLQFWARYQNDSSKNGHILAWTWVLAKSKQTFTFFRGQTFLKMNLQGDDDDEDDDDQTFLIAINMNLQGSHRETQRHSRVACGPSSNPKFKTILTHFKWNVPSPSFFYNPHHHTQRNWCHWQDQCRVMFPFLLFLFKIDCNHHSSLWSWYGRGKNWETTSPPCMLPPTLRNFLSWCSETIC